MTFNIVMAVIIAYILGSIPFAYIAGRFKKGIDVRKVGGGNVGALNTMREVGVGIGYAVLVADVAKGILAVLIARWFDLSVIWVFIVGFAVVAGHRWPVFLRFKGGRGAATAMGVFLALVPREFSISFAVIAIIILFTSNVMFAVVIGFACLPLIVWQFGRPDPLIIYSGALALFSSIGTYAEIRKTMTRRKGFIFDREYHFWQARKR